MSRFGEDGNIYSRRSEKGQGPTLTKFASGQKNALQEIRPNEMEAYDSRGSGTDSAYLRLLKMVSEKGTRRIVLSRPEAPSKTRMDTGSVNTKRGNGKLREEATLGQTTNQLVP